MVLLVVTPAISDALALVPQDRREELGLPKLGAHEAPNDSDQEQSQTEGISHTQLIALSRYLQSQNVAQDDVPQEDHSLNRLLRGSGVYIPPPPPKPKTEKTPEYLALMARLRAEQEAKDYQQMLLGKSMHDSNPIFANTTPHGVGLSLPEEEEDNLDPSLVINILVSVIFTGFAVYWAISNFRVPGPLLSFLSPTSAAATYPGAHSTQPARVFISLFAGIVVGIAEVVVYASYLRKVKAAKLKEKSLVEKKTVVREFEITSSTQKDGDAAIVKTEVAEEIWGRGVHGGVRRRIRERWQRDNEDQDNS
ncbi:hypothetical protein KEM56_005080 [Ascosphaera pollenicola]|nr:hypothetical protein KEM56_005080 [Ascosphaera pollenicola]